MALPLAQVEPHNHWQKNRANDKAANNSRSSIITARRKIICLDVCEDGIEIRQRERRPTKLHDSCAPALLLATARRFGPRPPVDHASTQPLGLKCSTLGGGAAAQLQTALADTTREGGAATFPPAVFVLAIVAFGIAYAVQNTGFPSGRRRH